jgi:indolepyruvate ferredoxin oxidoreductase beta subunit
VPARGRLDQAAGAIGAEAVTTNVVIAGLGGQGVIKASDILAQAAFLAGFDVKKSELHGMSQRGGSVHSDVRFGDRVLSPMVAPGEADYLLVLDPTQIEPHRHLLRPSGVLITARDVEQGALPSKRSLNVALLGVLSTHLDLAGSVFLEAIRHAFAPKIAEQNAGVFVSTASGRTVKP